MAGLAAFAMVEPEVFGTSWDSTVENVAGGRGFYGFSLIVLGLLLIGGYLLRRFDEMSLIVFSVATALPFGFLMAHLRGGTGGAYRVGPGDSLNRMLLHWLPLAVLSLIVMLQSSPAISRRDRDRGRHRVSEESPR